MTSPKYILHLLGVIYETLPKISKMLRNCPLITISIMNYDITVKNNVNEVHL